MLDEWCAKEGREPDAIERSCGVQGDPAATADALHAVGVRLFTVGLGGPDWDLGPVKDWLAWRDATNA